MEVLPVPRERIALGVRQAGMISRPKASSVASILDPIGNAMTWVTPQASSRLMLCATSSAVPANTKFLAIASLTRRACAAPTVMCSFQS